MDSKGNGTVTYTSNGYDTERYGTLPTNYTNGHIYGDGGDDIGPLNRYIENQLKKVHTVTLNPVVKNHLEIKTLLFTLRHIHRPVLKF